MQCFICTVEGRRREYYYTDHNRRNEIVSATTQYRGTALCDEHAIRVGMMIVPEQISPQPEARILEFDKTFKKAQETSESRGLEQ